MKRFAAALSLTVFACCSAHAQTLTAPDRVKMGAEFQVALAGDYDAKDFLSIVAPGANEGEYGVYQYAGTATVTLTAPDTPGAYEIRLLAAGSPYPTRVSRALTVEDVAASLTAPDQVDAGAEFAVKWEGPGNKLDYISWAEAGADDKKYNDYRYTKSGNPVTLKAPDEAGQYELRYFMGITDRLIARRPLTVGSVSAELKAPAQVAAGAEFPVSWTGPNNAQDFITLVAPGTPERDYGAYRYTASGNPVTMRAPDEPGHYELRYATGQSYSTLARAAIEVGAVTASVAGPASVVAGTAFTAKWTGPGNKPDYIALSAKGSEAGTYETWANVGSGNPVELRAPLAAGEYELRYHLGQSHRMLATAPLRVEPATQKPGKLKVTSAPGLAEGIAVEVIFDASGSMLQKVSGNQTRMDAARATLTRLVRETIPAGVPFALRVFGKDVDSCRSDLEMPLAPLDQAAAAQRIAAIVAKNNARTAIGASLDQAQSDLAGAKGERLLVLITDGEETCGGDPLAAIEKLKGAGTNVTLNIVGFAIDDAKLRTAFKQWSELGGGAYFDGRDAASLDAGVQAAFRPAFDVLDASGRTVARGMVGGDALELMPGKHTVRSGARSKEVQISEGETSEVAL
jgi:von Willebrand factor type A domain